MTPEAFDRLRDFVDTDFGQIACARTGQGPAAVFLHGVPLNAYHWRGQFSRLADARTCIAPDLLGLGHTRPATGCGLDFTTQARMVLQTLDRLGVEQFDLVGSDSGGAIAQIVAANAPERVRTLVLTNCDVHDNWPPPAFMPAWTLARAGRLADAMAEMLGNLGLARSDLGLGAAFETPEHITEDLVEAYIGPIAATPERREMLDRYVVAMDPAHTLAIAERLTQIQAPALIVWGTDDVFFPTRWAHWLAERLPKAAVVELAGSRLFFAEERPEYLSGLIRRHWAGHEEEGTRAH
jgi:pimeloyl-ACP methyl ester carboxylesterase